MTYTQTQVRGLVPSSWAASLEQVVRQDHGGRKPDGRRPMSFAPTRVLRPRAYDEVPVLMLVSSRATGAFQRPLYEAVEMLQEATAEFKVLVFTDDITRNGLRDFDWAVESCFSEPDWEKLSGENWLEMASRRVDWAQKAYGAAHVLAPSSAAEVLGDLRRLRGTFKIPDHVLSGALRHFEEHLRTESAHTDQSDGLRGWITEVPAGDSEHVVTLGEERVTLHVRREDGPGLLVNSEDAEWLAAGHAAGWSTVQIDGDRGKVSAETSAHIARAFADAFLDEDGPAVIVGAETDVADRSVAGSRILGAVAASTGTLSTAFGSRLEVTPETLPEALAALDTAHRAAVVLT